MTKITCLGLHQYLEEDGSTTPFNKVG